MGRQVVAQGLHSLLVGAWQVDTRDLVEADQVYAAVQPLQQTHDLAAVEGRIVQPAEADVLERATALVGEVVLSQQRHHLGNRHLSLSRHQLPALFSQRRMHRDGHVALALVEEALQLVLDTHAAHGDAPRTPGIAPFGRQDLCGAEHGIEVIHRLALTHKHNVRQALALGQGIDLIQDVASREVALKALLARLTEQAVHLTAHLTRDAERSPLAIGDKDGLYEALGSVCCHAMTTYREQVLDRAVAGVLAIDGGHRAHHEMLLQPLAVGLRDIRHLVDAQHVLLIEPLEDLTRRKRGHSQVAHHRFQLVVRQSEQDFSSVVILHFRLQS